MIRFLTFILQIAVLAALALWFADQPGTAHIVWHETVIETSAAFLVFALFVLAYGLFLLFRLWHFLRHAPTHWRLRRKLDNAQKGQDQITQGLIALASGQAVEAGRLAIAARKSGTHLKLTQWLQAQAAQLAGDTKAAQEIFRALAADKDAAILGYRGLITEAKRTGQWDEVDCLLTELRQIKPQLPWLGLIRMESAARRQQWAEAEAALAQAVAGRLLDSESGRRTRAALRIAAARAALTQGDDDAAVQAAEQAARHNPDWFPAQIQLAETLGHTGHRRAALRAIERAWKKNPHPQLAQILRENAASPMEAFKQTEHLCRGNESRIESRLALAEAALNADIWGEARRHLTTAIKDGIATQAVYKMLARLERRERGDERAAATWLAKASETASDPVWLCCVCGGAQTHWHPICAPCGSFDSLEWRSAGQSRCLLESPSGIRTPSPPLGG